MPAPPPLSEPTEPHCSIAVDLGTTTLKAIAVTELESGRAGGEVARAQASVALRTDAHGAAEQDPAAVYEAATGVLAEAARGARAQGFGIARIGFSAAMHSLLAVGADDQPMTPALTWIDSRAQAEAAALWASPDGRALYARTGTPIHAMTPLVKLIWLRRHRPELVATARRFVSLKEWVWRGWFGEWRVDAAIANASGLYNLDAGDWDAGALDLAGISRDQLSPIVPTLYVGRGVREPRLRDAGLGEDVACNIGASDGVLANLGVGATGSDRLVLTVGTSLAARFGSPVPVTDPATRSFCYVLGPGRFIVGGPSNSGGILLDWLCHKLVADTTPDALPELIAAAAAVETGALTCLPYVAGERAPLWDAGARAAFIGLDLNHTRAHLMRAAIEGILLNARWIVSGLFERIGRPQEIVATGHLFEPTWVRQVAADIFGIRVRHFSDRDASLVGAILLARIATGAADWEDAAPEAADAPAAEPANPAAYRDKYERLRRLAALLEGGEDTSSRQPDKTLGRPHRL